MTAQGTGPAPLPKGVYDPYYDSYVPSAPQTGPHPTPPPPTVFLPKQPLNVVKLEDILSPRAGRPAPLISPGKVKGALKEMANNGNSYGKNLKSHTFSIRQSRAKGTYKCSEIQSQLTGQIYHLWMVGKRGKLRLHVTG